LELEKEIPHENMAVDPISHQSPHGEPTTALIITLAVPIVAGLATWLLKDRDRVEEEKTLEFVRADGTIRRETIRSLKTKSHSKSGLIDVLLKLCAIDLPKSK
jgi:hypothetical protein